MDYIRQSEPAQGKTLAKKSAPSSEKDTFVVSEETYAALLTEIADMKQKIVLLKKALYGQKSEKTKTICENPDGMP